MNALITYRGCDDEGDEIIGFLDYSPNENQYYITERTGVYLTFPVATESLSIYTGVNDVNGIPIFASFELDGTMTKGGDVCYHEKLQDRCDVYYKSVDAKFVWASHNYSYYIDRTILSNDLEVVGKQYKESNEST